MKRRSFLLLSAGAAVAAAGGVFAVRSRVPQPPQVWDGITSSLEQFTDEETYDVCVIGSGIASAVLVRGLVEANRRVAVLESGFSPTDRVRPGIAQLEQFRSTGSIDYPFLQTRLRILGGTTGIWTGNCGRYLPDDFSVGVGGKDPWPLSYSDLEPHYERAEETLSVRGYDESPFAPPRRRPLPLPYGGRLRYTLRRAVSAEPVPAESLQAELVRRGLTVDLYPRSRHPARYGPVRALLHHWPVLTRHERLTVVTGATVTRLVPDGSGTVVEAEARDLDGNVRRVRARIYVIAAGGVESARLLLLSRTRQFPNGLGNGHDLVGRNFMDDGDIVFETTVPDYLRTKFGRSRLLEHQHVRARQGLGGLTVTFSHTRTEPDVLMIHCGLGMSPNDDNRWSLAEDARDFFGNPVPSLAFGLSELDQETLERGRKLVRQLCKDLGADPPRERPGFHWGHHHMGTCRMGLDPARSVVDANCRLHESPNCYIASSAVFPNAGAGHPTLLTVALAHRLSDHLRGV